MHALPVCFARCLTSNKIVDAAFQQLIWHCLLVQEKHGLSVVQCIPGYDAYDIDYQRPGNRLSAGGKPASPAQSGSERTSVRACNVDIFSGIASKGLQMSPFNGLGPCDVAICLKVGKRFSQNDCLSSIDIKLMEPAFASPMRLMNARFSAQLNCNVLIREASAGLLCMRICFSSFHRLFCRL